MKKIFLIFIFTFLGFTANSFAQPIQVLQSRVSSSADDAEELSKGKVSLDRKNLRLAYKKGRKQTTLGVRFDNLSIPKDVVISKAYIQFKARKRTRKNSLLKIHGENSGNAAVFNTQKNNITARIKTKALVKWTPPEWQKKNDKNVAQRTSDLTSIVQEIVSRADWVQNNAMVFMFSGKGKRIANSYDGDPNGAPELYVEYTDNSNGGNTPPTANAGNDKSVQVNQTISISGSGTDGDGSIVSYEWKKGDTILATTAVFNYTPTIAGTDTLTLIVTDNDGAAHSDKMNVTVTPVAVPNQPPAANAGNDKSVQVNQVVSVSGSGTDSDGNIVSYVWKKGDTILATTAVFNYTPTVAGTDTLTLTVTDDDGASDSDSLKVTVTPAPIPNKVPTANAGNDATVEVNQAVSISGSGMDSDGSIVSYEWKKGRTVLATTAAFNYTPTVVGTDTLTLTVTDDDGASDSDSMRLTVTSPINGGDSDGDGIIDIDDIDADNDGTPDAKDAFPTDPNETTDTDNDGIGNNADSDDDGDGIADTSDAFPLDSTESKDSDGDGIGDNADANQNDGIGNNASYSENYSRSEYRQMLFNAPIIDGNKHQVGGKYKADFEGEQWPETAHVLLRHIAANAQSSFFGYDGVSGEGMNYHFFWLAGMAKLTESLEGYQDPVAWIPPTGITKITKPLTHSEIMPPSERWNNFVSASLMLTLPDGSDCGIHDSGLGIFDANNPAASAAGWGAGGYHRGYGLEYKSISYLLPSFGQIGLGDGTPGDPQKQVQSLLHFSPKYSEQSANEKHPNNGHAHADSLMMGLFGKGRNLLSFPGHQHQSHGPHNKNIVSIGTGWQNHWVSDLAGRLEAYAGLPGLQIGRVDSSHIMHGGSAKGNHGTNMNRYRRTLLQNTVDIDKSYLLDIFEVDGGSEHNYVIRGSGVLEQQYPSSSLSRASAALPYSGDRWDLFKDTKKAEYAANQSFWVDFKFSDNQKLGSRTHFPAQGGSGTLYTSFLQDEWTTTDYHPHLMLYRNGTAPVKSTFIAAHEVLDGSGNSFISSITQQSLNGGSAVGVVVTLKNGRVDTYLISFDGEQSMEHNSVYASAVIAASSSLGGKSDLWMVDGTSISDSSNTLLNSFVAQSEVVSRIYRKEDGDAYNAFETPMNLPDGYTLSGQTLLLEHFENNTLKFTNGHTIERIESIANGSRIHLRYDPGVLVSGKESKELYYPWRTAESVKLRFVPAETTVPRITHIEPGREQWQRMTARVGRAVQANAPIAVTTVPANTPFNYIKTAVSGNMSSGNAQSSLAIDEDMSVSFSVDNPLGLAKQVELTELFRVITPAIAGAPGTQGLNLHKYSGGNVNFDLNNNRWDSSGTLNYYDLGRWGSTTINGLTYKDVPGEGSDSNPGIIGYRDRGALIDGYIDVPKTGLYRFYTRMDGHAQIKIDDKTIVQQAGMRRAPQWVGEVYLEKGLHSIFVHYFVSVHSGFSVMWDGPEIPYSEIPTAILYKDIQ